jgi:hypothetical protein
MTSTASDACTPDQIELVTFVLDDDGLISRVTLSDPFARRDRGAR